MTETKKRNFVLKNINIEEVNVKYSLNIISNLNKEVKDDDKKTKIKDVIFNDIEHSVSFLDENKKDIKCIVTMVDIKNNELPEYTDIKCFWCRHNFETKPIGCPIKYINTIIEKSYISHITKDKYYMRENISTSKLDELSKTKDDAIEITPINNTKGYYLTDGIFCSFNCTLSFIKSNNHNIFYKESMSLLHSLYYDFVGKQMAKIIQAPDWRILKDYGGSLDIETFRSTFNKINYKELFSVRNIKDMKTISKIYKEN
jgi:hypothetical protein